MSTSSEQGNFIHLNENKVDDKDKPDQAQGCQTFLCTTYLPKRVKIYQNGGKYTK
jgi:hypothetical protein